MMNLLLTQHADRLGFSEVPEMQTIRTNIQATGLDQMRLVFGRLRSYLILGRVVVEKVEEDKKPDALIGMLLRYAAIAQEKQLNEALKGALNEVMLAIALERLNPNARCDRYGEIERDCKSLLIQLRLSE